MAPKESPCFLVVDDEPAIRHVIRRIVSGMYPEFRILEAADGDEALDLLDGSVVCIIADIRMPRRDGLRMCWAIRNTAPFRPWRQVPIILVSASCHVEEVMPAAWNAGTTFFLLKPFAADELAQLIWSCTGIQRRTPMAHPAAMAAITATDVEFRPLPADRRKERPTVEMLPRRPRPWRPVLTPAEKDALSSMAQPGARHRGSGC
jgi:two-component system, chemotaxis family, chemotaxis protein CheY